MFSMVSLDLWCHGKVLFINNLQIVLLVILCFQFVYSIFQYFSVFTLKIIGKEFPDLL